jgi:hypothetical protein
MNEVVKILSVFLTCALAFGKIGFPTAFMVFDQDFVKVIVVSGAGGIAGNVLFTYLSAAILKLIHNFRAKRHLIHKKKIFTGFNRKIIRVKQKFGLAGIAFITPMFLSTPVGAFLAERFFRDKKKIILYLSISTVVWSFALYFILLLFYDSLKGWLV